jgi:hypothetical protein
MSKISTNRDLYLAITALCAARKSTGAIPTLEIYLRSLWRLSMPFNGRTALTPAELFDLVSGAFDAAPSDFSRASPDFNQASISETTGFGGWQSTLIRQIVDIREMDAAGQLSSDHRYFGLDAPRGGRWYNFDPITYLECGLAGALGGWEPDDVTGRQFVPGPVAVLDADGQISSANPDEIERVVHAIPALSWELLVDFLWCGQQCE